VSLKIILLDSSDSGRTKMSEPASSAKRILLFDVDGTLTMPRGKAGPEITEMREKCKAKGWAVGIVGGSDLAKQVEQLGPNSRL